MSEQATPNAGSVQSPYSAATQSLVPHSGDQRARWLVTEAEELGVLREQVFELQLPTVRGGGELSCFLSSDLKHRHELPRNQCGVCGRPDPANDAAEMVAQANVGFREGMPAKHLNRCFAKRPFSAPLGLFSLFCGLGLEMLMKS